MNIIDGKKITANLIERLKQVPAPKKFFAAILVGDNAASKSFLKQKEKVAIDLGVNFQLRQFAADITKADLRTEVQKIIDDTQCGGILFQLPLPDRSMEQEMLDMVPLEKDVDVLGTQALAAFYSGDSDVFPPPVGAVIAVLGACLPNPMAIFQFLTSSTIVIVGAGRLVGQPIATWLTGKAKEVVVLDQGDDLMKIKNAELVICGTGVPGLVTPMMLKENAIVIDFGYGVKDGKTMGDFDPAEISNFQFPISYTPTPGGTGPVLVAKLFENFYQLNREK